MDLGNFASLRHFIPEMILVAGILAIVIIDLAVRDKSRLGALALIAAAAALVAIGRAGVVGRVAVPSDAGVRFVCDLFPRADRAGCSRGDLDVYGFGGSAGLRPGPVLRDLLASTFAMFLMAESANLLMAYLALEFVSLTSYILTGFLRHNRRSLEPRSSI